MLMVQEFIFKRPFLTSFYLYIPGIPCMYILMKKMHVPYKLK